MIIVNENEIKETIAKNLGISNLSEKDKDKIIFSLMDNISSRANIKILDMLSEKERNELFAICQLGEKDEIISYLKGKIDNLNQLISESAAEIIKEFKSA